MLIKIGGVSVSDLIDPSSSAADSYAAIVEKATQPTRPLALTFKEHHARTAKNKLKAAMGMRNRLRGLTNAGAEEGVPPTTTPSLDSVVVEEGALVKVNGRQWKVLDLEAGDMVQLQLVKSGGSKTASKAFVLIRLRKCGYILTICCTRSEEKVSTGQGKAGTYRCWSSIMNRKYIMNCIL